MKKNNKILFGAISLLPVLLPTFSLISCSSKQYNEKLNENISENLTKEQVLYINNTNVNLYIKRFTDMLSNDGILNLSIFKNLISINENAFVGIKNINKIIFNEKIVEIKNNAFKNINSLKELIIPSSLENIGSNAFDKAFNGSNVIVNFNHNDKIKNIGSNAFANNDVNIVISKDEHKIKLLNSGFQENKIIFGENPLGGNFNGLIIDKYLSIISALNLNQNSVLSSLTNDKLTNELKSKFPNKNYSINILEDSSEYNGILKLNLNINNKQKNNINISGFNSLKKEEHFFINKMTLNSNEWFKNLQKKENIKSWTKENWVLYLSNLEISNYNSSKIYDLLKNGNNVTYEVKYENEKIFILLTTNYKKFNSNSWISDDNNTSNIRIGLKNNTGYILELPSKNNLYDFIKNILEVNSSNKNENITQKYSSYYLHGSKYLSNTLLNNILQIPDKYISYIKENLNLDNSDRISIEFNEIFPNDIDGIINFSYRFVDLKNNLTLFIGAYQISGFKKIENNINVSMKILKKDGSYFYTYLKQINSFVNKAKLNNMKENESIELNNFGFSGYKDSINLLYEGNEQDENSKKTIFDYLNKTYELKINDIILNDGSLYFKTNYFSKLPNDSKGFVIRQLSLNTDKTNKGKIVKKDSVWIYTFPLTISLYILNSTNFSSQSLKEFELSINCSMIITQDDVNSLKK